MTLRKAPASNLGDRRPAAVAKRAVAGHLS